MAKKQSKVSRQDLEQQIEELTYALQRERADATNVRRRADEERVKMASFYKANVIRELLPVIDNFERSIKHIPKDLAGNDYVKGIQAILSQLQEILEKLGVERIETVSHTFDPNLHEAISMEEGEGEREVVCEELQPGYKLGDEIIRHAMVKVKCEI